MVVTIENVDNKLLDVIKSIIKLSPNANVTIEDEPTKELLEAIKEVEDGKTESFYDFESYKKAMNS
ncbi:hypothetical protein [Arcobacter vandammei]|uniref:hypothetical protein n=1 Tax=Arcobacter vandammei TaxID=2782243 RepID=UPI0018DF91FC|nr:hypothetical protein [Arcobacter vandammei]